jgi:hypothetical protein
MWWLFLLWWFGSYDWYLLFPSHAFYLFSLPIPLFLTILFAFIFPTLVDCPKIDKDARRVASGHKDALVTGGGYGGDW